MPRTERDISSSLEQKEISSVGRLGQNVTLRPALPNRSFSAVGPFVFLEHLGPLKGLSESVPPHPHAGIEVITYLLIGTNEHRDSRGNKSQISSGAVQWITSGSGVLHSEVAMSDANGEFEGIQIWTKLPAEQKDCVPGYSSIRAEGIPNLTRKGTFVRLIAGSLKPFLADPGPVRLAQPSLLAHIQLFPGSTVTLPIDLKMQIGMYLIAGSIELDSDAEKLVQGDIAIFTPTDFLTFSNRSKSVASAIVLGGEPAERPILLQGSYVYSSRQDLDAAKERFRRGEMGVLKAK